MIKRFLIYGMFGWAMEIVWTSLDSIMRQDMRLIGFTNLWMFLIYGCAVFLEPIHDRIAPLSWPIRGLIWVVLIWTMEYLTGALLQVVLGVCPWHYDGVFAVNGLIRLDFAPAWFIAGLFFEWLHGNLVRLGFT